MPETSADTLDKEARLVLDPQVENMIVGCLYEDVRWSRKSFVGQVCRQVEGGRNIYRHFFPFLNMTFFPFHASFD